MFLNISKQKNRINSLTAINIRRKCSQNSISNFYKQCFAILEIPTDSGPDETREAYIKLVKRVHPDSGSPDADAQKFTNVDNAFRTLQAKFARERRGIEDDLPTASSGKMTAAVEDFDINHTAPQHRQYLSYEGLGHGTPSQREKQYQSARAIKAYERVIDYRLGAIPVTDDVSLMHNNQNKFRNQSSTANVKKHAIKTKYGFDRVVEDLIQEAISKGDFDNLQGYGKPLNHSQTQINPYVDFTQAKINKILLDNGFCPEWIMLQKSIRCDINELKLALRKIRKFIIYNCNKNNNADSVVSFTPTQMAQWNDLTGKYQNDVDRININIDKYNFLVPILNNQMIRIRLDRVAERILLEKLTPEDYPMDNNEMVNKKQQSTNSNNNERNPGFFSFFSNLF